MTPETRSVSVETTDSTAIAQAALEYAAMGWRVVPLYGVTDDGECNCRPGDGKTCPKNSHGKHPRVKEWQKAATTDEEVIAGWFERWPASNVGVALGEHSNLCDLETDADGADKVIAELFGGELPITATYTSGRGKHRLFKWRMDLPGGASVPLEIGGVHFGDLKTGNERRGSQSVFPPSRHWSGKRYQWILDPATVGIMEFPDVALARLINWSGLDSVEAEKSRRPAEHWDRITKGVGEGQRATDAASLIGRMLSGLLDPFDNAAITVQWQLVEAWNARNKPPLTDAELRAVFDSILNRERRQRTNKTFEAELSREARPKVGEKAERFDGWRLQILDTKPQLFRLFAPLWDGWLELSAAELIEPYRVRVAAMEQKQIWVPKSFDQLWRGHKGETPLGRQLVESAEKIADEPERHRDRIIAGLLLEVLSSAKPPKDGPGKPDAKGRPALLDDGSIVFDFSNVWGSLAYGPDKIKRGELSGVLSRSCADWFWWPEKRMRLKRVTVQALKELRRMAAVDDDGAVRTAI